MSVAPEPSEDFTVAGNLQANSCTLSKILSFKLNSTLKETNQKQEVRHEHYSDITCNQQDTSKTGRRLQAVSMKAEGQ